MVDHDTASFNLLNMFLGRQVIIDSASNGWVNLAIVVAKGTQVLGTGRKGDGSMTWVTIATKTRPLNVAFVYAPA